MKKALDFLTAKPARFFLLAALLWFGLMCFLNSKDVGENGFSWHDILVEANGMFFDLLVFGICLSVYEALREKKEKIERLNEEIDDFRRWDEKEATFRIVGAIKRLNKLGVSNPNIDLTTCFFEGANLSWANLQNVNLQEANLENTNLKRVNLSRAFLLMANLDSANLQEANLQEANLQGATLREANLLSADFKKGNLKRANLQKSDLRDANLKGANLEGANLTDSNLIGTNFGECNLKEANLTGANLNCANLIAADLQGASIVNANLQGANLRGANLQWTIFHQTNIKEAIVGNDWFDKLEKWETRGRQEIIKIYNVDENGILQLR